MVRAGTVPPWNRLETPRGMTFPFLRHGTQAPTLRSVFRADHDYILLSNSLICFLASSLAMP